MGLCGVGGVLRGFGLEVLTDMPHLNGYEERKAHV